MLKKLRSTLSEAGESSELISMPDGGRLLILPYGARVLGLGSSTSEDNLFWTHTALNSVESVEALHESEQWHNSGGDQRWVSPEIDVFFPKFPDSKYPPAKPGALGCKPLKAAVRRR